MSDGFPGVLGQLSTALASGTTYTSINVSRTTAPVQQGMVVIIGFWLGAAAPGYQAVTASATVQAGAESIPVNSFTAAANFPVGTAIAEMPALSWNWLDGINQARPQTGTPHPYHVGGSYSEVAIPQDLIAHSSPAAGSSASLVLTNPQTTLQALITITGWDVGLINDGTGPAAAIVNAFQIIGSIGGQYVSEGMAVPTTPAAVVHFSVRGQQFVSGNGVSGNFTENMTLQFSVAGVADSFQRLQCPYHFGA